MDPTPDTSIKAILSLTSQDCDHCKSVGEITFEDERVTNRCSRIFHTPCENCKPAVSSDQSCSFCQHLRLIHIIKCVFSDPNYRREYAGLQIFLGTIEEVRARQPCQFCALVAATTDRAGAGKPDKPLCMDIVHDVLGVKDAIAIIRIGDEPDGIAWGHIHAFESEPRAQTEGTTLKYQIPEEPDWTLVSHWIRACTEHGSTCSPAPLHSPPQHFKLIDVDKDCVVSPPPLSEYVALSYVWGQVPTLKAARENIHRLGEAGSLSSCDLPPTLKDAMAVCRRLEKKYLWVDALCVVQDDQEVLQSHIGRMNLIYRHACLTIVACAGSDANYGLPGVSRPRIPEVKLDMGSITLVELPEILRVTLGHSKWHSRAWTYQEAVLSSKLLFLRNSSMVFECSFSDDKYEAGGIPPSGAVFNQRCDAGFDFFSAVDGYSHRELTDDKDVLRAFAGILTHFHGDEHLFGMPLQEFDAALLWYSSDGNATTCDDGESFPSWSWISMRGADYNASVLREQFGGSLASWAFVETDSSGCHIPLPIRSFPAAAESNWTRSSETGGRLNFMSLGAAMAWREGCIKEQPPYPLLDGKMPWEGLRSFISSRWPTHEQFWEESRVRGAYVDHFSPQEIQLASHPGRVLGLAQFATLRLVPDLETRDVFTPLKNAKGNGVGHVWLNETQSEEVLSKAARGEDVRMEFIALSLQVPTCRMYRKDMEVFDWDYIRNVRNEQDSLTDLEFDSDEAIYFRDKEGELLRNDDGIPEMILLNVMMVEQRRGVYRRSNLGRVALKRWLESDAEFRSFVLG